MPLFYQHSINGIAKIGVWHIKETENFFLQKVPLPPDITHWHKRLQHLAGRYLLQELVPGFPYHLIEIADTRKPFLPNEAYHFSISHSGDYAAVIVTDRSRVGIDLEWASAKIGRIKHKFLNGNEMNLCPVPDIRLLTLLWAVKETVFKWYGNGKVDFRKHINISTPANAAEEGVVACEFLKDDPVLLHVHYRFFHGMCLTWLIH